MCLRPKYTFDTCAVPRAYESVCIVSISLYIVSSANQLAITTRTSTVHSLLRHIVYVVLVGQPVYREDAIPNGRMNLCVRFNFE